MFKKIKSLFGSNEEIKKSYEYEQWLAFRDAGVNKVRLLSMRDKEVCSNCFEKDGNEYPVTDSFDEMPLPHSDCSNDKCRCSYLPIIK